MDDEGTDVVGALKDGVVGHSQNLSIDFEHPAHFKKDISLLFNKLRDYQGLILDWRLDETADEGNKRFIFRAGALAQEIRTREAEKKFLSIPIVIWSEQDRLKKSYQNDSSSHDLFDKVYKKEDIADNPATIREQLVALANGYKTIQTFRQKNRVFKLNELLKVDEEYVDIRVQEHFTASTRTTREIARFIIRELLERPGLLIDELRLASRFGIDKGVSKDWKKILKSVEKHQYSGPFGEAWERWWAFGVEKKWWLQISGQNLPLSSLNAKQRVDILRKKTGFKNLITAEPIKPQYHSRFYTICEYTKRPLDPVDGVIIAEKEPQPWQERKYISLDIALERREGFEPHSTEIERLKSLRRARG